MRVAANAEFLRFLLVGGTNTVLGYVLFALVSQWMHYEIAYTLVYIAGIIYSYVANSLFVFREVLTWRKFMAFPLVYVVQYLAGVLLLPLLIEVLHVDRLLALPIVIVATLPVTFVLSKLIIRRGARGDVPAPQSR
jgi:putative flippase GtrA